MAFNNTFDGGTDGVALSSISLAATGGASGDAFSAIYGTAMTYSAAAATDGSPMGATVAGGAFGGGQWTISGTSCAFQIKFKMKTLSTADAQIIQLLDGTGRIFSVHVNSIGKLRVDDATGTTGEFTFANVLTVGQYYFLKGFVTAGTTTSNGVIKVVYFSGSSQTPAETQHTNNAANLGTGRSFTIGRGGKLTASPEAYDIEGPFTIDTAATDIPTFPVINLAVPASALATGAPAPTVSGDATITAKPASATSIGAAPVVSAETDVFGDGFPSGYAGVVAPAVSAGAGVTVLAKPFGGSSAVFPAISVTAGTDALVVAVMNGGATSGVTPPVLTMASTTSAALTGSGSLSSTATIATSATAPGLSGSGSLTVPTVVPGPVTAAALSGAGSLSGTVRPSVPTTATLTGSGTLVSAVTPATSTGAVLSGSGVLTGSVVPGMIAAATLTGSGILTGSAAGAAQGAAALSGLGVLTGSVVPSIGVPATLSGAGVLTSGGLPALAATATLAGSGTLTVVGGAGFAATVSFTGLGELDAAVRQTFYDTPSFSGSGTLTPVGTKPAMVAFATLSGAGVLLMVGGTVNVFPAAFLTGVGELDADGFVAPLVFHHFTARPGRRVWSATFTAKG